MVERLPCESGRPVLAFLVSGDHAYFYRPKAANLLLHRCPVQKPGQIQERLSRDVDSDTPCPSSWLPFEGLLPGHYYVEDEQQLHLIRVDLLKTRKRARVLMRDHCTPRALQVPIEKATCTIHLRPPEWTDAHQFIRRLDIPGLNYQGEGVPLLSLRALLALNQAGASLVGGRRETRYPRKG